MATLRVQVEPSVLEWAIKRSGREEYLFGKHGQLGGWLNGEIQPTLKQLKAFANDAYAAEGYMFLSEPPIERMPIPDFRTVSSVATGEISPNLRDTVYICQRRQDWYRRYAASSGYPRRDFVGSAGPDDRPEDIASAIRDELGWTSEVRRKSGDQNAYRRAIVDRAEMVGILVMVNGIVGDNTHRPLDRSEFRGFALHDDYAPLVFVNAVDALTAQMFTLAHEFAHLWCGQSALSDSDAQPSSSNPDEVWCNVVAAEVVVPRSELESEMKESVPPLAQVRDLSHRFKVSEQVILRRFRSMGTLGHSAYLSAFGEPIDGTQPRQPGGDYRYTKPLRVSRLFARAIIGDAFALNTTYAEAFNLLDIKKGSTFHNFARVMGF